MAQARALEHGRYLLRSTNNGITAIVDHRGRISERLPQFTQAVLTGEAQIMIGRTPFSYIGVAPIVGFGLLLCLAAIILRQRTQSRNETVLSQGAA